MGVIIILIGLSMLMALVFLVIFLLNVKKGQYDDMYTPSVRILFENQTHKTENHTTVNIKNQHKNGIGTRN